MCQVCCVTSDSCTSVLPPACTITKSCSKPGTKKHSLMQPADHIISDDTVLTCRDKLASDTSGFMCVDSRKTQLRGGRAAGAPRAAAGIAAGTAYSQEFPD